MANDLRVLVYPNKADKTVFFELDVLDSNGEAGNFPLTFQLVDIAEPKNRKSDFSKTVTFPGTARNNLFFDQLFEITVESSFNPNLKKYVSVLRDGQEILRGTIKLNSIKREKVDLISYECTLFGQFANIFQELKITDAITGDERDLLIRDLFTQDVETEIDWYSIDHELNINVISKTWDGVYANNGSAATNIDYSVSGSFTDTFYVSTGDWVGRLGLTGSVGHGLQVGETVRITMDDPGLNPTYNGEFIVVEVPTSASFVINTAFVNSSVAESGSWQLADAIGSGYVYPLVNFNNTPNQALVWYTGGAGADFYPAIYTKEILDRIFKYTGFTYDSDFFDSQLFKRLTFLSKSTEKLQLSEAEITDRLFRASKTANSSQERYVWESGLAMGATFVGNNDSTNGNFDNPGSYNNVIGRWNCSAGGWYDFTVNVNLGSFIDATGSGGFLFTAESINATLPGGLPIPYARMSAYISVLVNGVEEIVGPLTNFQGDQITGIPVSTSGYTFPDEPVFIQFSRFFQVGDDVDIRIKWGVQKVDSFGGVTFVDDDLYLFTSSAATAPTEPAEWYLTIKQGYIQNAVTNPLLPAGSTIPVASAVDQKMTASQFLSSLFSMFNLYVYPDKIDDRTLIIEPRDDFYYDDQVVNWTDKLDRNRDFEITPLALVQGKTYTFGYKEDKDFWNDTYLKTNLQTYGSQVVTTENDFTKNKKEVKVEFSPSPMILITGNKIIPSITKSNVEGGFTTFNPRILFYGGLKPAIQPPLIVNDQPVSTDTTPDGNYYYSYYPYAGHLDDPFDPTVDLNWGYTRLFYQGRLTENTLVNRYYVNYLDEILSKDSRVVTGFFRLTAKDIRELDFRKQIIIDGVRYRLLKVTDYNATRNDLTQVELLKVLNSVKFNPKRGNYNPSSGNNTTDSLGNVLPGFDDVRDPLASNNNTGVKPGNVIADVAVLGRNNSIRNDGTQILIQGNYNDVQSREKVHIIGDNNRILGADSSRINLINSDNNVVEPGVTDVFLINTIGVTVSTSNTTYIGGVPIVPGTVSVTPNELAFGSATGLTSSDQYFVTANGSLFASNLGGITDNSSFNSVAFANATTNTVLGGQSNAIIASPNSEIVPLASTGFVTQSFIAASNNSTIDASTSSTRNAIISSFQSSILSNLGAHNTIISGSNNTISGSVSRSAIIGGSNLTLTQSDTVLVPNLIVKNSLVIGSTAVPVNNISLNDEFIYMGITAVGTNYIRSNGQYLGIQTKNPGTGTYGTVQFYVFDDGTTGYDGGVFVGGRIQQFIKPSATSTNTRGFVTYGGTAGGDGGTYEFIFRNNETVFKAESVSSDVFFRLSATASHVKVETDLIAQELLTLTNTSGVVTFNSPTFTTTVNNTRVTANTIIILTAQSLIDSGEVMYVSNIVPGTSFDITFVPVLTSTVDIGWMMIN